MLPQLLFPFPAHEHAACNWPRWARGFAIAHFQAGTETLARRSRGAREALAGRSRREREGGAVVVEVVVGAAIIIIIIITMMSVVFAQRL